MWEFIFFLPTSFPSLCSSSPSLSNSYALILLWRRKLILPWLFFFHSMLKSLTEMIVLLLCLIVICFLYSTFANSVLIYFLLLNFYYIVWAYASIWIINTDNGDFDTAINITLVWSFLSHFGVWSQFVLWYYCAIEMEKFSSMEA